MSQEGIEPSTRGLKVPCSTTELLALFDEEFIKSARALRSMGADTNLVQKMPASREDHRNAMLICRRDDFFVALRAARLYDRFDASLH